MDREKEILRFELEDSRAALQEVQALFTNMTMMLSTVEGEREAAKSVAAKHLLALEEAQAEIRSLRESVRLLSADVAHYAQFGPAVPAFPQPMVEHGNG